MLILMRVEADVPYCTERLLLAGAKLNVAAGATARDALVDALSVPLEACKERVEVPSPAPDPAVSRIVRPADVSENGEAGETVTPAGRPESVTITVPVKPFCGASETLAVADVPGAIEIVEGLIEIVKEGGADGEEGEELDPPPHPAASSNEVKIRAREIRVARTIVLPFIFN
jgi:hypothetical protein